jgi:prepilin-type N-terminal cleavage/methylation domain-containing protein
VPVVTLSTRARDEAGFGLVELLIAMTVMAIGITAIVAGMSSGFVAVNRARDASTAAAVADKQMEAYRALPNCAIYLEAGTIASASPPYTTDSAYSATQVTTNTPLLAPPPPAPAPTCTAAPAVSLTNAQQPLSGADGRFYNVDTYIVKSTAVSGGDAKKVTLVVHNPENTKVLLRESSIFAPPTGCDNTAVAVSTGC